LQLANTPAAGLISDKDAEVFQYLKDISVIEPTDDEADKAKADDDFKIVFVRASLIPRENLASHFCRIVAS
jgi:hypothetical protein